MTPCPRCGAPLHLDRAFERDMQAYNDPRRRYACLNQHTYMTGMPAALVRPTGTHRGRAATGPCDTCGVPLEGESKNRKRHERCDAEHVRRYAVQKWRAAHPRSPRRRTSGLTTATWAAHNAALAGMGR